MNFTCRETMHFACHFVHSSTKVTKYLVIVAFDLVEKKTFGSVIDLQKEFSDRCNNDCQLGLWKLQCPIAAEPAKKVDDFSGNNHGLSYLLALQRTTSYKNILEINWFTRFLSNPVSKSGCCQVIKSSLKEWKMVQDQINFAPVLYSDLS